MSWKETLVYMVGTFLITAAVIFIAHPKGGAQIETVDMRGAPTLNNPKGM